MNRLKHVLLRRHSLVIQLVFAFYFFFYASTAPNPVLAQSVYPGSSWATTSPADMGMDETLLDQAVSYARGSGYIIRSGRVVKAWGSATTLYDLRSATKAVGSIATALAIQDGRLSLSDFADQKHPSFGVPPESNLATGWLPQITLKHLVTQTAGFDKDGGYTQVLYSPGSRWSYSDSGPNWLAEITTLAFGQDLRTVLFNRVFSRIGIPSSQLTWRANLYRSDTINGIKNREYGSGIKATVNAMARIGYLYLRNGRWNSQQLVLVDYIAKARVPQSEVVGLSEYSPSIAYNASDHYGLFWWNNGDGTLANVPTDAYWAWGMNDSVIAVIPSLDIVAVRAGTASEAWQSVWKPNYSVMRPFLEPIVQSTGIGSTVEILAAPKGTPKMQLRINDKAVATFTNITGSYSARTFTNYTYWRLQPIAIKQIKVALVNDSSANDLYIDKIILDGAAYQSEAPATYSTGVYTAGKCQFGGGYFQSERLACNGYFQYASVGSASSASILEQQPAGMFMLLSPPKGATSAIDTPTFMWSDGSKAACYLIEIDDNSTFSSPVQQATIVRSTQYQSITLASGLYYWRVQTGGTCSGVQPGDWSEVWSLTVSTQ